MNQQSQWTAEIAVNAPLKTVWEVANDVTLIPRYHPQVDTVEVIAGQAKRTVGTRYQCNIHEGGHAGSCVEEVLAYEPESMVVTGMVSDTSGYRSDACRLQTEGDRLTSHRDVDHPEVRGLL